jgi:hypothetical protein
MVPAYASTGSSVIDLGDGRIITVYQVNDLAAGDSFSPEWGMRAVRALKGCRSPGSAA